MYGQGLYLRFQYFARNEKDDFEIYHYRDAATYTVPPHHHDFYELYCLLENGFQYHVEENVYPIEPGSLVLVRPGEIHWPEFEGPPREVERIVLWLNPRFVSSLSDILPQTLGNLAENLEDAHLIIPEEKTYQVILGLLYSLLYEKNRNDSDSPYLCGLILSQLLIHICRALNQRTRNPGKIGTRYGEIMKVHDYINNHFRETISVNDLAQRFFMDKNTLTRQFKRIIGLTPGDYIRRKRLESAHALIRQGYGALNAGYASGFTDYSAFYRAFRQLYGLSPSDLSVHTRRGGRKAVSPESKE